MTIPANHILPGSSFRHIGIMVMFMYYMAAFSLLGFLSVHDITRGWIGDIKDTMTIEIPAFDKTNQTVFTSQQMDQRSGEILLFLKNDPLVASVEVIDAKTLETGIEELNIPSPVFITMALRENRATNAEARLVDNIQRIVPQAIAQQQEDWEADIRKTALIFQAIFCGLALSIVIVTCIILSAVVRTQLKANDETVKLVHLMGAQVKLIATLFKRSITVATFWGVIIGGIIAILSFSALIVILGIQENLVEFYIYLAGIALIFIMLCRLITHLTVLSSLKGMP